MDLHESFDFLVVGHICRDKLPNGYVIGGAAAYAGAVAMAAGCRTAIVTSAAVDDNWQQLTGVEIHKVPSDESTIFENIYTREGRVQIIHSLARYIERKDIPEAWHRVSAVLLAPIANEVDPKMIDLFSNSVVALAPQGWLRNWDEKGQVFLRSWPEAEQYLRQAAIVFISDEDLIDDQMLNNYREWSRLLVLTQGAEGCTIFAGDEAHHFSVEAGPVVETTGAGDVFAAAFLMRFIQTDGNPFEAARYANKIAALSVSMAGLEAKIAVLERNVFC